MNDALRRAARGTIQVGLAEGIIQFLEAFVTTFDEAQHVAALWLLTTVVTFVQNMLEDNTAFPALLKAPPGPARDVHGRFTSEGGHADTTLVFLLAALATIGTFIIVLAWAFESGPFS